jgi:hypothetical protein
MNENTHDKDPGDCRKALGRAGHRARADARGGKFDKHDDHFENDAMW